MSVLGVELQTRVRKMDMPASYQKTRMTTSEKALPISRTGPCTSRIEVILRLSRQIVPTVFGPMMLVSEHFIDTSWPFLLDGCALVSEGGW